MKEINGRLFRVRGPYSAWLVETSPYGDWLQELAEFCAQKAVAGQVISSVTELYAHDTSTPRVAILNTKEYKAAFKTLMAKKEGGGMNDNVVKIVASYDQDGYKGSTCMRFKVPDSQCDMVETQARNAIKAYLNSEEGRKHAARVNFDFNWGDAVEIPDEFFRAQGLIRLPDEEELIVPVDHDEVFRPD